MSKSCPSRFWKCGHDLDSFALVCSLLHFDFRFLYLNFESLKSEEMEQKRNTFKQLFFVKKQRINQKGESPIYLRITINGKTADKVYIFLFLIFLVIF